MYFSLKLLSLVLVYIRNEKPKKKKEIKYVVEILNLYIYALNFNRKYFSDEFNGISFKS